MNVALKRMTVNDYLAWAEQQPHGRFELVEGQVVAMNAQRVRHVETKYRVLNTLKIAVADTRCHALGDGVVVRIDDWNAYEPDALVYCGEAVSSDAIEISAPVVIVEVLSPGTKTVDTTKKLEGYFKLTSVRHYLIVDPAARTIVHHARRNDAEIATTLHKDGELVLSAIGVRVPVAACFPERD